MKWLIIFMLASCSYKQPTSNSVPKCYTNNADGSITIFHCPQPLKNINI